MSGGWPLTGRAEELRFIAEVTAAPEPAGVVLAGAAGVGKTRLAREALAAAKQRGAATRWTAATVSAQALPLGTFAAVLGAADPDPPRLVQGTIDRLLAGADGVPVVVGVDDAHLLDDLSAVLVHQLALRRAARIVLTLRSGEPAPDAVSALWKDGHLRRLELQPLSAEESSTLLEAVLGGPVDSFDARRLWVITQGNVLYLRHLVEGELNAGRLHEVGGVWRWSGNPALPPGLAELVQARIGKLTDTQHDVIEALAVREPLEVSVLARLTDPVAMEQMEARGLVKVSVDGQRLYVRLGHPLYGEVGRAICGQLRARRWRGRIAQALADTGSRRTGDVLRRAVLTVDSDLPLDPGLLTVAAGHAGELMDFALAARLAHAAVGAGGGFAARMLYGHALRWSGRGVDTEAELAALTGVARTDTERVQVTVLRIGNLFWTLARPAEAEAVLAAAERTIADGAGRELVGARAVIDAWLAKPAQAVAAARSLTTLPCSPAAETMGGFGMVTACGSLGRLDGLDRTMRRIEALSRSFISVHIRIGASAMWLRALRLAGLLQEGYKIAQRYYQDIQDMLGMAYLFTGATLGEVARDRGQVRTATRLLRQASVRIKGVDLGGWSFYLPAALTPALAMTGDAPAARQALAELEANLHPSFVFMQADVLLARAWVAAAEGTVSGAIALAREAAKTAASQGQPALEVFALHTAVCFGDRTVAERLAALATQVDGPRAPAAAAHAAALAADDGAALHAASIQLEQMGAILLAADAAAHAATSYMRHSQRGPAHAAATRAQSLAEACEGARTPALAAVATPMPLTEREREIVTLAARGMTNREIAEQLVVSVRTVEGHLYRASAKLGTSNRAELAALLQGT